MITFTKEEFFEKHGVNLDEKLDPDDDSKHVSRFIDFICREIDKYLRRYNPRLMRLGYDKLSEYQIETIKEGCMQHGLNVYQTGHTFIDESGIPKIIPLLDDVKDILRPLIYRGN